MTRDPALIERIVASVLEQLQPAAPARIVSPSVKRPAATESPVPVITSPASPAVEFGLTDAVVTAAVLEKLAIPAGALLLVGPKTIVTPSAHDWLRQHKVTWRRNRGAAKASSPTSARWQLLASSVTPTVRSLLDLLSHAQRDWQTQITGAAEETLELAVRLIATAEMQRVLVISVAAEAIACRANRNERVRASVIQSAEHLRTVEAELSPNIVVLNPQTKSLMELRHLVQTCAVLGAPRAPHWH